MIWFRVSCLSAMLMALTGCGIAQLWHSPREDVLRRILPSSVQIVLEQQEGRRFRTGSGVVIAARSRPDGAECFILTSGHTVAGVAGRSVSILFGRHEGNGEKAVATVLARRETDDIDVALLSARGARCAPARPGLPPALGEPIWVVAFPWGRAMTLASGIVSQVKWENGTERDPGARLMVDASVSYGSSGGGVFEARTGALIGLVEGYRTARIASQGTPSAWFIDVPVPGQTFVTPLDDIRRFLAEHGHADLIGTATTAHFPSPAP